MSLTVEQLLIDAKKLANRLKDDETKADNLITQAKSTHNHVEALKQYTEDVEKLNEAASQRPHSVLIAGLKRESQHMRELRAENRELRIALAEYQNSVKLIMSKYRQQVSQLVKASQLDISSFHNTHCSHYSQVILKQYAEMEKMRRVMKEALNDDEFTSDKEMEDERIISTLMTENKGLRELLHIHTEYGCKKPTPEVKSEDLETKENVTEKEEGKEVSQNDEETEKKKEEETVTKDG